MGHTSKKHILVALSIIAYLVLLVNTVLFATISILELNRGLVFNTLGTLTTNSLIVIYTTWTVVYVYQLISIIFTIVFVVNQRAMNPVLVTPLTLGLYIVAQFFQIVINTVFLMEVSFPFLAAIGFILLATLISSYKPLYNNRFLVAKLNLRREDPLIRGLFQNALDLYMTWVVMSAVFNFGAILINRSNPPINPSIAYVLVLVVIIVFNFFYIITDLTLFDTVSCYTLSLYFLRLWVFDFLIQTKNNVGLLILEVLILAFTLAALAGKFGLIVVRRNSQPLIPRLT